MTHTDFGLTSDAYTPCDLSDAYTPCDFYPLLPKGLVSR